MKLKHKLNGNLDYKTVVSRFQCGMVYRMRDKTRALRAAKMQDKIRAKTKSNTNLTLVIREWRDRDASNS